MSAPTGTEATTARIAEVLAEHAVRQRLDRSRWVLVCSCGERIGDFDFDERSEEQQEAHRAHVAAALSAGVIRDMQAAAWDEGHHEGCGCDGAMNPYRAARIEEQP